MLDVDAAHREFDALKTENIARNQEYFLLRQAVRGNFRWPRDWPAYIPKIKHNLCKPIVERFATFLMGRGFSFNVERPNSLEARTSAEITEKILKRSLELSHGKIQFEMGAKVGSQLGRTVFKVYRKGRKGFEHACFTNVQPDYFYGIPDGAGDFSVVYYSYPLDIAEVVRMFGPGQYLTEADHLRGSFYDPLPEENYLSQETIRRRRVPILEVWTRDDYLLEVGGRVVYNGKNPYRWAATGEGFIPFVVIENIRSGSNQPFYGESDIAQVRELNEHLNFLLSRRQYLAQRWLMPTLVWEGAPPDYVAALKATIGGGGALPTRMGSRLYFLAYDRPNPAIGELEATLRNAILETAGISELALHGTVQGSVNTGPSLAAQFQPTLSTIDKKRLAWEAGLSRLLAMMAEIAESIGDSKVLGKAVINQRVKSADFADGDEIDLSGKQINGLRDVTISWPGILPSDDVAAARLEMEKAAQGLQSIYTTLERFGVEFPDDEIARIRMENTDPALRGEKVAEQMRATAPILRATAPDGGMSPLPEEDEGAPPPPMGPPNRPPSLAVNDADLDEPVIGPYGTP